MLKNFRVFLERKVRYGKISREKFSRFLGICSKLSMYLKGNLIIHKVIENFLDKNQTAATDFVKERLKQQDDVEFYVKLYREIPYKDNELCDIYQYLEKDIDNIPLTRVGYKMALESELMVHVA